MGVSQGLPFDNAKPVWRYEATFEKTPPSNLLVRDPIDEFADQWVTRVQAAALVLWLKLTSLCVRHNLPVVRDPLLTR